MPNPPTMKVEYIELMDRARAVEEALPEPPQDDPQPPCGLPFVKDPTSALAVWAGNIRQYLEYGQRARNKLGMSLRNAAKAYHDADVEASDAINGRKGSGSIVMPQALDLDGDAGAHGDSQAGLLTGAGADDYVDLKTRCQQVESGDQGASLQSFADAWLKYATTLRNAAREPRFTKPFDHWEGDAEAAVMAFLQGHQRWMLGMADHCEKVGTKARDIASAHRVAAKKHIDRPGFMHNVSMFKGPLVAQIEQEAATGCCNADCKWGGCSRLYLALRQTSDEVIGEYHRNMPEVLAQMPDTPPTPTKIDPPPKPGPIPVPRPFDGGDIPNLPNVPSVPNFNKPETPLDGLLDALKADDLVGAGAPGKPTGMGGMKAASFAGGLPLEGWGNSDAASRVAGTTAGGIKVPAAYAALGGGGAGMGGMPPMAPGAQNQGAKGGKRPQSDQEALYTEERAWTEGVIGRRRPPKETKETASA